jgi:hypothetical protein
MFQFGQRQRAEEIERFDTLDKHPPLTDLHRPAMTKTTRRGKPPKTGPVLGF